MHPNFTFSLFITLLLATQKACTTSVHTTLSCSTTADCHSLVCASGKRLCDSAYCSDGECEPPICVNRNQLCPVDISASNLFNLNMVLMFRYFLQ